MVTWIQCNITNGGISMRRFVLGFSVLFLLSACSEDEQNNDEVKEVTESIQVEEVTEGIEVEETFMREITEEERQRYNQLMLNGEYEKVEDELSEIDKDDPLKDYYHLALVFIKEKEYLGWTNNGNLSIDFNNPVAVNELKRDEVKEINKAYLEMKYILSNLKAVKEIPFELKDNVDKLKVWADEESAVLTPVYNEYYAYREELSEKIKAYDKEEKYRKKINNLTANPQPVSIGMTMEDVITEGWGRPEKINKTTTAYGISEQWVYAGYRYLYFKDGYLTAIQE